MYYDQVHGGVTIVYTCKGLELSVETVKFNQDNWNGLLWNANTVLCQPLSLYAVHFILYPVLFQLYVVLLLLYVVHL